MVVVLRFHGGTLSVEQTVNGVGVSHQGLNPPELVPRAELIKVMEGC